MNAAQSNQARTTPGSHNPDFDPENPAVTWVKENKAYLAFLILMITGIASWQYFWPQYQRDSLSSSWSLFQELSLDETNFSAEKLEETLSRSRTDPRIHPWVVHAGVTSALNRNDQEALKILRTELQALANNEDLAGYRLVGETGPESLFAYSLAMVDRALAPDSERVFRNPTPTGPKIRFTLKVNGADTYDFEAGLYPEAAPEACAWFLDAVRSGRMVDLIGIRQGSFGFKFSGFKEEGSEHELLVEREWGFFHLPGTLYLVQAPGKPGQMDDDAFELGLEAAPHLDGQTSVIGMLSSGLEYLEQFQYAGPDSPDTIDSLILTSIQVIKE